MDFIEPVARVMKQIDTPDGVYAKQMAAKIGGIEGLCTFPVVAQMVLKILSSENYKMATVSAVINRDPALAAKIMRLANSAFFSRGKEVDSIDKAMVRLGRANVVESVCAVATMDMFPDVDGVGKDIRDHCAATAAICQEIVTDLLPSHKNGAFLCGLMHDVGKLMLIASGESVYNTATEQQRIASDAMVPVERAAFGYDHALLAAQILSLWKFPDPIPLVVALHHEPALAYQNEEIGYVVAMCRIASQVDRQLAYNMVGVDEFVEILATGVDCAFAAVSEDYLLNKWETLSNARTQALSVFGPNG
ncbi:MAG: HDOD domain-containing protein [Deltaproteobacteria bacterium]|nr:HDOD domain-containing protein [Deltaproteobacteria bacterium]MBN2671298.1 HDOD domain-containing protein [Deltaproteobacteria bacterium]